MPQNPAKRGVATRAVNEALRKRAMDMLAEGIHLVDVAKQLVIDRSTVRLWRDSPEGRRLLAEARKRRESEFETAAADARAMLKQHWLDAVHALVEDLRSPGRRGIAAREILDRIGVLRAAELIVTPGAPDLSKLTEDELDTFRALQRKASGE